MDFNATLHQVGLKSTPTRVLLLEHIYTLKQPLCYADIKTVLTIDKATFYRNMSKFEEAGIVTSIESSDKRRYYEYRHNEHAHFICNDCGKIECLETETIRIEGYKIDNVVVKGSCIVCIN